MTTRITIDSTDTDVTVHVTDDTGRFQTATMPRYPDIGADMYVKFVDRLDIMMYTWENRRGNEKGQPVTPSTVCYSREDD